MDLFPFSCVTGPSRFVVRDRWVGRAKTWGGTGNCDNSGSHLRPTVEALALKC